MINLNLLPWRINARKRENALYYTQLLLSLLLGVLILCVGYGCVQVGFYKVHAWGVFLKTEQEQIKTPLSILRTLKEDKQKLDVRMTVIQTLEKDRALVLKLLDTLPKVLPAFVHLKKIIRKNAEIVLEGAAHTNAGIALLMKNIEAEKSDIQFSNIHLSTITRDRKGSFLRFKITLSLMNEDNDATVVE